jgi:threonine/homoserine/homoserine lactone efflux protein
MGVPPEVKIISIFITIFMVLWTGGALFITINPYYFWKVTQGWKALREPPKVYFLFMRVMGAIFTLIGLTILLLPYFHK